MLGVHKYSVPCIGNIQGTVDGVIMVFRGVCYRTAFFCPPTMYIPLGRFFNASSVGTLVRSSRPVVV